MGRMVVLIVASWLAGSVGAMAQEPVRTEPVVVTATRIEEKVSEQASSVSVVTREDMERKSPSLAGDVLQGIPGVDVQRTGSLGGLENIKIRGGKSTHTLVMIDGFPVNSPSSGEFDISALPVSGFERVEVVRGAQSALYGSNAMGGVVNFLPRKGEEGRQYGAGLSGGSFNTLQWSGFGEGAGKGGNLHLGVSGLKSDGTLPNDDTDLFSFAGSGGDLGGGAGTGSTWSHSPRTKRGGFPSTIEVRIRWRAGNGGTFSVASGGIRSFRSRSVSPSPAPSSTSFSTSRSRPTRPSSVRRISR